jgi:ribosomal protein S18 acetylase RimI-like enzyme
MEARVPPAPLSLQWSSMELISLGYQTDLALLQLGGSRVEDLGDHIVIRSPHNPSHWWGNFLLLAQVPPPGLCQWWLDRFAAEFPGAEHIALGFDGKDGTVADLDWFAAHGFHAEASTVMTASEVHEPVRLNTDAVYRELCSDEDWSQSVELRVRCEDRPLEPVGHRAYVTAAAQTNRQIVEAGQGAWFGAFIEGRLVAQMGLVSAGGELARFQAVETDPDHRRRGLAGSLLHHVSSYGFRELGAHTLVMVADPDYFAIDLYRSVGFATTETQLQIERPPAG